MRSATVIENRSAAGRELASRLLSMDLPHPVVLALPRGGVPVAFEIAKVLRAPLDLLLVRKIGVPDQPELAAAAIVDGEQPELVVNEDIIEMAGIDRATLLSLADRELEEIERRRSAYLGDQAPVETAGRSVIVVDDGIATGATVRAALRALARRGASQLVLAVPVAPPDTVESLTPLVDEVVCLATPEPFYAIGAHYRDFHQLTDDEVVRMLAEARSFGGDSG